jgi:uncharacterized protein (DUF488 family)
MTAKHKLFTIGYEKRNIDEYIELLLSAEVDILVDVRQTAWSYKREFCKTKFNQELSRAGITYLHLPEAGNPKKFRAHARSVEICLKKYRGYLVETKAGLDSLKEVLMEAGSKRQNVCITCFERDVRNCHRSVIIEFMQRRLEKLQVIHL